MSGEAPTRVRAESEGVAPDIDPAEAVLIARLRAGYEDAFNELIDRYYPLTARVARHYVRTHAVAEEVVQEAWMGVIQGLKRFEGRSTLKTWILRIVANVARKRARQEARSVPLSSLAVETDDGVDISRFRGDSDAFPGHWNSYPAHWGGLPDAAAAARETLDVVRAAIEALPEMQRLVITLRDIDGWEGPEIAEALDLSAANQRVLLHRARSKVRAALERHFADE